jgi:hypothetical protein
MFLSFTLLGIINYSNKTNLFLQNELLRFMKIRYQPVTAIIPVLQHKGFPTKEKQNLRRSRACEIWSRQGN